MAIVSVRTRGILQILGFLCYLKGGFQLSDIGRSSALPEAWIQWLPTIPFAAEIPRAFNPNKQ